MARPPFAALVPARGLRARGVLFAFGIVSVLLACTTTPKAKATKECDPGAYVFCRCRDRQEGTKLCKEDGKTYGPCEPCETFDNPEGYLEPGDPGYEDSFPERDAGKSEPGPSANGECGNGIVESGEDCDDANTNETDGCDSECKLAGATPFATNACPGLEVHVWGGAHQPSVVGTTVGSGNRKTKTPCGTGDTQTGGASSADRVFHVVAHKTGTLTVTVTETSYNAFLYASDDCPTNDVEALACANEVDGVGNETLSLSVTAGKAYYVFVDGALPSNRDATKLQGNFRVTFSIP